MGKRKRSKNEVNASDQLESQRKRVDKLLQRGIARISRHLEAAKKTDTSEAAAIKVQGTKRVKSRKPILTGEQVIDTRSCATEKVQKSLKKILSHPTLPESIKTFEKEPKDGITRDIISKLWNYKGPQKALNKLLAELENALDLPGGLVQQGKKAKARASEASCKLSRWNHKLANALVQLDKQHIVANEDAAENVEHNAVHEEPGMDSGIELAPHTAEGSKSHDIPLESVSSAGDDKAKRRLKPDLAVFERMVRHAIRQPKLKQNNLPAAYRPPEQPSSTPEPTLTKTLTATSHKGSAFLPSLSAPDDASIYGSDSSDSDLDILKTRPQRKNRPGQKARRLRNERKFGNNARHLRKDRRDAGWDMKRGAVEQAPRLKKKRSHDNLHDAIAAQSHGNKRQKRDDEGTLHPSWMAKKKMKAAENSVMAWSGKKMTFDD